MDYIDPTCPADAYVRRITAGQRAATPRPPPPRWPPRPNRCPSACSSSAAAPQPDAGPPDRRLAILSGLDSLAC